MRPMLNTDEPRVSCRPSEPTANPTSAPTSEPNLFPTSAPYEQFIDDCFAKSTVFVGIIQTFPATLHILKSPIFQDLSFTLADPLVMMSRIVQLGMQTHLCYSPVDISLLWLLLPVRTVAVVLFLPVRIVAVVTLLHPTHHRKCIEFF